MLRRNVNLIVSLGLVLFGWVAYAKSKQILQSYSLVGTIKQGDEGIAVIRHESSQRTYLLRPGDQIPGDQISVLALGNKGVILEADGQHHVLSFKGARIASLQEDGQGLYQDNLQLPIEYAVDPEEIEMRTDEYFEEQEWLSEALDAPPVRQRRAVVTLEKLDLPRQESVIVTSQQERFYDDWDESGEEDPPTYETDAW